MEDVLLKRVLDHYRNSHDFNGMYFKPENEEEREAAVQLVTSGSLQVVSEEDYPNPHIRPWPSLRSQDQQIESIRSISSQSYGICLYPTPDALRDRRNRRAYPKQPYRQAMAKGRGTLELAYFSFEVLEQYRNDPRFLFQYYDFGVQAQIGDDAYLDPNEPEHDKTGMSHIGFAYDLTEYDRDDPSSVIVRRICAFYGDLAKLTPLHQQRWKTYQLESEEGLKPHPAWWTQQMGHWPDGLGPFERFFFELSTINELHQRAFGGALFKVTDRPGDFGWILRPSQNEWDTFVHQLDKFLSENIRTDALDALGVAKVNDKGQQIGTLNRLQLFLESRHIPEASVRAVLAPIREVRSARQRPAHALRTNINDRTFIHRQVDLLARVNQSLFELRSFWQTHPANTDWEPPDYAASSKGYRM